MLNHLTLLIGRISLNISSIITQQSTSTTAISDQLTTWKTAIGSFLNIITGLFAVIGGFLIFLQYMQGNDQAQKNFVKFIIGLAIIGMVNLIAGFFLS